MNPHSQNKENILPDFGFSPNFFTHIENTVYTISKNPMRKISSENAVLAIPVEEQLNQKKKFRSRGQSSTTMTLRSMNIQPILGMGNLTIQMSRWFILLT